MPVRGASFIRGDLSLVVQELREEPEERDRQAAAPEHIPVLQVNNIDFSYGHVQVLFDVAFDVGRGETLALLGTDGADKSTILKAIRGLGTPSRGVVRLNGRGYPCPPHGQYAFHRDVVAWGARDGCLAGIRPWAPDSCVSFRHSMSHFAPGGGTATAKPVLDAVADGLRAALAP